LEECWRRFWLSIGRERSIARREITRFGIVPRDTERIVATLSGGNQQKSVLARAAATARHLLVLDDPTAGVDVHARVQIHSLIRDLAGSGVGILLLSTELDELVDLADRVLVLRRGQIASVHSRPTLSKDALAEAIFAGVASNNGKKPKRESSQ
jgi:ABC-type sugar transport system ATPase subunit